MELRLEIYAFAFEEDRYSSLLRIGKRSDLSDSSFCPAPTCPCDPWQASPNSFLQHCSRQSLLFVNRQIQGEALFTFGKTALSSISIETTAIDAMTHLKGLTKEVHRSSRLNVTDARLSPAALRKCRPTVEPWDPDAHNHATRPPHVRYSLKYTFPYLRRMTMWYGPAFDRSHETSGESEYSARSVDEIASVVARGRLESLTFYLYFLMKGLLAVPIRPYSCWKGTYIRDSIT